MLHVPILLIFICLYFATLLKFKKQLFALSLSFIYRNIQASVFLNYAMLLCAAVQYEL